MVKLKGLEGSVAKTGGSKKRGNEKKSENARLTASVSPTSPRVPDIRKPLTEHIARRDARFRAVFTATQISFYRSIWEWRVPNGTFKF